MSKRDEKKSEQIGVRVAPSIREAMERIAEWEDRSLSWMVNRILEEWITRNRPELLDKKRQRVREPGEPWHVSDR